MTWRPFDTKEVEGCIPTRLEEFYLQFLQTEWLPPPCQFQFADRGNNAYPLTTPHGEVIEIGPHGSPGLSLQSARKAKPGSWLVIFGIPPEVISVGYNINSPTYTGLGLFKTGQTIIIEAPTEVIGERWWVNLNTTGGSGVRRAVWLF